MGKPSRKTQTHCRLSQHANVNVGKWLSAEATLSANELTRQKQRTTPETLPRHAAKTIWMQITPYFNIKKPHQVFTRLAMHGYHCVSCHTQLQATTDYHVTCCIFCTVSWGKSGSTTWCLMSALLPPYVIVYLVKKCWIQTGGVIHGPKGTFFYVHDRFHIFKVLLCILYSPQRL